MRDRLIGATSQRVLGVGFRCLDLTEDSRHWKNFELECLLIRKQAQLL